MSVKQLVSFFSMLVISIITTSTQAKQNRVLFDYFSLNPNETIKISIKAPDIAENGAVVPIKLLVEKIKNPSIYIKEVSFFSCHDFSKAIARFTLSPKSTANGLSTRIKLMGTANIYAFAVTNTNQVIIAEKQVKVTSGGCGASADDSVFDDSFKNYSAAQQAEIETWQRSSLVPNVARLHIAGRGELTATKMRASIKVQGFRARILLDMEFYNPYDVNLEGSFNLRLPKGASPYYIAFGDIENHIDGGNYLHNTLPPLTPIIGFTKSELALVQTSQRSNLREGVMAEQNKARNAYRSIVYGVRPRDPALVEWDGSGIYRARVFPLLPDKNHRVIMGYDIDLPRTGKILTLDFPLPKKILDTKVYVHLLKDSQKPVKVSPESFSMISADNNVYEFINPKSERIVMQFHHEQQIVMTGTNSTTGHHFVLHSEPMVKQYKYTSHANAAMFMIDTSYSTKPANFNNYVNLVDSILEQNESQIKQFAVLFFNISTRWWQTKWVKNNKLTRSQLFNSMQSITLEGATDFHRALTAVTAPPWQQETPDVSYDLFVMSDGVSNWGDTKLDSLKTVLQQSLIRSVFSYVPHGEDSATNTFKSLNTIKTGSTYIINDNVDVTTLAKAHHFLPWNIVGITAEGSTDILIAGAPDSLYPGQILKIAGRGKLNSDLILHLSQKGTRIDVPLKISTTIDSELTARVYGEIAVNHLDALEGSNSDNAVAYSTEYRVTSPSTSLVMLESAKDYAQYNITPESYLAVINSEPVTKIKSNRGDLKSLSR